MLNLSPATADTGTSGTTIAVEAQRMEAVLWTSVLEAMSANGFSESSLGTGSGVYNQMFLEQIANRDFGSTDASLTQSLVNQISHQQGAAHPEAAKALAALVSGAASAAIPAIGAFVPAGPATPSNSLSGISSSALATALSFAQQIWPSVKSAAQNLQVPPQAILAQSALETGWGQSVPADNAFGIKAVSGQSSTTRATNEFIGGVTRPVSAAFAAYGSLASSVEHYISLIKSNFSGAVGSPSVAAFASSLQAGGYATDPEYAAKIVAVAQSPMMGAVLKAIEGTAGGGAI